ncbi:MAG TPA: outer membrane beta-barrel protein [Acidobacteriota bacterium]|nr:outer membrane beta-barrel protein [Acidobacteriota bacterium]
MARKTTSLLVGLFALLWGGHASGAGLGLGAHYSVIHSQSTDDNSSMLGAQVRLRGAVIGVEGAIDYRNEELGNDIELKSWPVSVSLLVYPIPSIYALAGLAWYNTTLDFPANSAYDDDTQSALGYQFGAGVELPVAPKLKLTGDIRWQFIDYEFDDIPSSIGKVDADSYSLNVGVLLYLM